MRKLPGVHLVDVTEREADDVAQELLDLLPALVASQFPLVRFEKWQALGNDYVILEESAVEGGLDADAHPRPLRRPHRGRRRRHPAARRGRRAGLRRAPADLQPRRLRGRALGQRGARGLPVPAPPRMDGIRRVLDRDGGRRDPGPHHRHVDVHARRGPGPARRARARSRSTGAGGASATSRSATRRRRSGRAGEAELADLDLRVLGPPIEHDPRFPGPHERLLLGRARPGPHPRADLGARRGGDARPPGRARAAPRSTTWSGAATRP